MAAPALASNSLITSRCRVWTINQSGANDGNIDIKMTEALLSLSLQLTGTYNAGTLAMQGSNNGSTFVALPTAVSLSALGVKSVALADLAFLWYRLAFSSMDASNVLVATLVAKMNR